MAEMAPSRRRSEVPGLVLGKSARWGILVGGGGQKKREMERFARSALAEDFIRSAHICCAKAGACVVRLTNNLAWQPGNRG